MKFEISIDVRKLGFLYFGNITGKLFFVQHTQNIPQIFKFREYFEKCIRVPGPLKYIDKLRVKNCIHNYEKQIQINLQK